MPSFQILMQNNFQEQLNQLIAKETSFLLFRKPNTQKVELWFDEQKGENQFVFHPFNQQEPIVFHMNEIMHMPIADLKLNITLPYATHDESITYEQYLQLIEDTVHELNHSSTQKIVISRIKEIPNSGVRLDESLKHIHQTYPQAFVYLWYSKENGVWIGASPELLLEEENLTIQTVSLAGTLPKEEEWTAKEIHEQQVVTDYIVSKLQGFKHIQVDGPHTVDAGFFNHLKSFISAEVPHYQAVEETLRQLHPTPAVCGMPKEQAKSFILAHEGYDRKYYAGYFGFKTPTKSQYFVNLRCAQIFSNTVKLYVGGGIMPDSDPEKEWKETELKSKTIGNLLVTD